mmetsp:Transcript_29215/g.56532  ORF Transcript_29215/g.56532 Transcript_29215/m.56532 type:complete len:498 (+) Transcript_29215:2630-4123(+)
MARFHRRNEDVINSSLSELILFLFFFFLIMLATLVSSTTAPGKSEDDRLRQLLDQLNQSGLQAWALETRLESSLLEIDELTTELRAVTDQLDERRRDYAADLDLHSEERSLLAQRISSLESENTTLGGDILHMEEQISQLSDEVNQLNADLVDENRRRLTAEMRLEELRKYLIDLLSEFGFSPEATERNDTLGQTTRSAIESVLGKVSELEKELQQRNGQIELLESTLLQRERGLERYRRNEIILEDEKRDYQEQLAGAVSERVDIEAELLAERMKYRDLIALIYDEQEGLLPSARADIVNLEEQVAQLIAELNTREEQIAELRAEAIVTKWPASLELSDDDGYRFDSGSYIPSEEFLERFRKKGLVELMNRLKELEGEISVIEILGHTDEQFLNSSGSSNLDQQLISFISGGSDVPIDDWKRLNPKDNAGLGLARAAAITVLIRDIIKAVYPEIRLIPLSAGQLIEKDSVGNVLAEPPVSNAEDRSRRRIEIRFRG